MEGFREPFEARKGVVSGVVPEAPVASAIQFPTRSTKTEGTVRSGFVRENKGKKGERWKGIWTSVVVLGKWTDGTQLLMTHFEGFGI